MAPVPPELVYNDADPHSPLFIRMPQRDDGPSHGGDADGADNAENKRDASLIDSFSSAATRDLYDEASLLEAVLQISCGKRSSCASLSERMCLTVRSTLRGSSSGGGDSSNGSA